MTCSSGGSSGASYTQLQALGAADLYLSFQASMTHWRSRYNKCTNFAMEAHEQTFSGNACFGGDVQVHLNRTGDLIHHMYVVIDLPGITAVKPAATSTAFGCGQGSTQFPYSLTDACDACNDGAYMPPCQANKGLGCQVTPYGNLNNEKECVKCSGTGEANGPWAHWTNAIGQFLIKKAEIVIGSQVVDTMYNDFLYMWEELSGKPGKRLTEMIGKRLTREELIEESAEDRRLYVPLPFWFTHHSGNSLPLVALQFHGVSVAICFSELRHCIQVSGPGVQVIKSRDCSPITANDLHARLDTTYVYLDIEERDRFATGSFEQLIHQVQTTTVNTKQQSVTVQLNFNHPIIELIWAVKRKCQEALNNHFNYSGKYGKDPIEHVHLKLNNLPRFQGREARYFRLVQAYQHHTNIPDAFVYCYSFALHPESPNPSGACNFSKVDKVEMTFDLQQALHESSPYSSDMWSRQDQNGSAACGAAARSMGPTDAFGGEVKIVIFGRNYNVFKFREGLGGRSWQ